MKQPELGHKIQNWRKAKGLTQEELVEQCNLNVRTLQRIEAGEVLPRSYTIKSILAVLKVDFSELNLKSDKQEVLLNALYKKRSFFKWGAVFGIIYLCFSFVESFVDIGYYLDNQVDSLSGFYYSLLKVGVLVSFTIFYYPIYLIGKASKDRLIRFSSLFLIVLLLLTLVNDVVLFYSDYASAELLLLLLSVMSGIGYILLGIAFVLRRESFGTLFFISGIVAILTGLGFISILLAIPALFSLTVFEVLLLVIILRMINPTDSSEGASESYLSSSDS